jgi:hypothetical protein
MTSPASLCGPLCALTEGSRADRFGAVSWKVWLEGHAFDLETLSELFSDGDPLVTKDPSGRYYVESSVLLDSNGQFDPDAAGALVRRMNGVARSTHRGFLPVRQGQYTAPDGRAHVFGKGSIFMRSLGNKAFEPVESAGPAAPESSSKGLRYLRLAEQDADVADVLRVLGQPEPLDWYDIYKVWEIVEHAVGGWRQVEAKGWATKPDIDRLTASANHPGISGDEARHARMSGAPGPSRTMTVSEADALVRRLVANWIQSNPSY